MFSGGDTFLLDSVQYPIDIQNKNVTEENNCMLNMCKVH